MKRIPRILITILTFTLPSLISCIALYTTYVHFQKLRGKNVRFLSDNWVIQKLYSDKNFDRLIAEVKKSSSKKFQTIWDVNQAAYLEEGLFSKILMYGQEKYRYKPFVKSLYVSLWDGLKIVRLALTENDRTKKLLDKSNVLGQYVLVETDEFGFKKTDFPLHEGDPIILFLGDSFTEGLGIDGSHVFSNIVGHLLRDSGISLIPVNGGVNGYSALEMAWTLENMGPKFNTKIIVVNIFPNDVQENYVDAILGNNVTPQRYENMFQHLEKMRQYATKNDSIFLVSIIPPKEQMTTYPIDGDFQRRVLEWCKNNTVTCINPLEFFRQAGERHIYSSNDPHFSEEGHEQYANFLFERIRSELIARK